MTNNPYFTDSLVFFKNVSTNINESLSRYETINLTLNFALGTERLLKGVLFHVNPLYVLMIPEFKNSLPIFYNTKIISEALSTKEIAETPNEDVITFKNSLLRAQLLSKTIFDNKALLFNLANARDIIVHHELTKLDIEALKMLLLRDYYILMKSFSSELHINAEHIFYGKHIQLAKFSSKLQDNIEKRIELRFEALRSTYKMLESNSGYCEDKEKLTVESYNKGDKFLIICPCCCNSALIYAKSLLEYNPFEKRIVKIGYNINKLKCFFCKLEITDYQELDYLKISIPAVDQSEIPRQDQIQSE